MSHDADIARRAILKPIEAIGAGAGLAPGARYSPRPFKAKVSAAAQTAS